MDVDGANPHQLTHHPDGDSHPRWSPDGQRILFSSDRDGDADIWTIGVDGTGLRKLTSMPGVEARGSWSPDGSRVVFQWEGDLWLVASRGGEPSGSLPIKSRFQICSYLVQLSFMGILGAGFSTGSVALAKRGDSGLLEGKDAERLSLGGG